MGNRKTARYSFILFWFLNPILGGKKPCFLVFVFLVSNGKADEQMIDCV